MKIPLALIVAVCWSLGRVRALSCVPCAQTTCEKRSMVKYCSFGFVLDMCGCCFVCGKGPGAACGGQWAWHGRCGRGLECRYPEVPKGDVSPPFFPERPPGALRQHQHHHFRQDQRLFLVDFLLHPEHDHGRGLGLLPS
ncbi:single insulin-like growth factor-binding domain protein-2 [Penaeus monodon]|uniref:single insulin-like growth factor-binding domain protein-2 n=1 Tax=Penaeus monodon TaxID=6687 RepID=UPI0018A6EAEB|nr:single insulin-like growth factor-binding domain protein-2 [Penaeus monodon]